MKTSIVGCGLVGRAWAISFARAAHEVVLHDADGDAVQAALAFIDAALEELAAHDLLDGQGVADVRGRIGVGDSLAECLDGSEYVQESTFEDVAVKKAVFAELDALAAEETVLASSSSAILPSLFTADLAGRGRCLVAHPINPPYLVPAVEVVPAPWTRPEIRDRVAGILTGIGQAPIVMKREIDGFVMNRLQGALLQEAFRLVAEGYASPTDVDVGIRRGLGLRWSFLGPFETIDLNAPGGARDYAERYEALYEKLWSTQQHIVPWSGKVIDDVEKALRATLPRERLAERQLWRDRRLMALIAHQRASE
jgi:3-hydroxyacyl-CoA dehydrogenase